ncbi:MAG: 50S ribosomal protein L1 [Planctomycetes bacterium]|nr:50S ribosomal protein L1 [Planctomycetota bacterium]
MSEDDKRDEIRERAEQNRDTAAAIDAASAASSEKKSRRKKFNRTFKPSKRYKAALAHRGDRAKVHQTADAIRLLKELKSAKFDESLEVHIRLGVNPKKSDQQVRGTFVFPHGVGKSKRVIAFAEGPLAEEAKDAGAIEVGGAELAKRISDGWLDFDVVVAHPAMMRHVGRLGKILGPKKLMPNPKEGSVTPNVGQAVREFSGGKMKYRLDDGSVVHMVFGKKSFEAEALTENLEAFLKHLQATRPTGAKGLFFQSGAVATTMSPGVAIDLSALNV